MVFKKSENNFVQDSLILTINFIDGNGDLGLSNDENSYPYHQYNAIIDENFNWITYGSNDVNPPFYIYEPNGSITFYSNEDNRNTFNCNNYIIDTINSSSQLDTFYIQKNINNKNIFIEFYKKMKINLNLSIGQESLMKSMVVGLILIQDFPTQYTNTNQVLQGKLDMVWFPMDLKV